MKIQVSLTLNQSYHVNWLCHRTVWSCLSKIFAMIYKPVRWRFRVLCSIKQCQFWTISVHHFATVSFLIPTSATKSMHTLSTMLAVDRFLTHWGRDKMADFSQTTFSNVFSISLKFVPEGPINKILPLFQKIATPLPRGTVAEHAYNCFRVFRCTNSVLDF